MVLSKEQAVGVSVVVSLALGFALGIVVGGFGKLAPADSMADPKRVRDASFGLLTNMLSKLADTTKNKAAKIAAGPFKDSLEAITGIFRNTSQQPTIPAEDDHLCGIPGTFPPRFYGEFRNASYDRNYSAICLQFGGTATQSSRIDSGALTSADFISAFNGLMWALIELDNTIASDP